MVSTSRMPSQKKPPIAASQRTPWESLRCMKKSITRTAFVAAMVKATGALNGPRSR